MTPIKSSSTSCNGFFAPGQRTIAFEVLWTSPRTGSMWYKCIKNNASSSSPPPPGRGAGISFAGNSFQVSEGSPGIRRLAHHKQSGGENKQPAFFLKKWPWEEKEIQKEKKRRSKPWRIWKEKHAWLTKLHLNTLERIQWTCCVSQRHFAQVWGGQWFSLFCAWASYLPGAAEGQGSSDPLSDLNLRVAI